ncbi:MAG TPA: hypothetical protein VGG59_00545, partial [Acidobacteriaceae bacterium]
QGSSFLYLLPLLVVSGYCAHAVAHVSPRRVAVGWSMPTHNLTARFVDGNTSPNAGRSIGVWLVGCAVATTEL